MITVGVTGTFDRAAVERMVDDVAREAVNAGAKRGAAVARAIAATRSKTGQTAAITVTEAQRTETGWRAEFASHTKNAWYQNDGTLAKRRKDKRKRTPVSSRAKPGTGVAPLFFLDRGLAAGRGAMLARAGLRVGPS